MADTAHTDPEMIKEHEESLEELTKKAKKFVELLKSAKHFIAFTGAGISTSAGIPDFRGPEGVWTLKAQGKERKAPSVSSIKAVPTYTHMSLVKMYELGMLKFLVSQNTDGLHRKSGINPENLAELHGNTNLEFCKKCGRKYSRDFRVREAAKVHDHVTTRTCTVPNCGGKLYDTIINFGENLPEKEIDAAFDHAEKADLCLSMGSSLTVTPAADVPKRVAKRGKDLVIVNLQHTPLDKYATLRVYAKTDDFMKLVAAELKMEVPSWKLKRRITTEWKTATQKDATKGHLLVKGVDVDGIAVSFVKEMVVKAPKKEFTGKEPLEFNFPDANVFLSKDNKYVLPVELEFMGHYKEPKLAFNLELSNSLQCLLLEYDPFTRTWQVSNTESVDKDSDLPEKLSKLAIKSEK